MKWRQCCEKSEYSGKKNVENVLVEMYLYARDVLNINMIVKMPKHVNDDVFELPLLISCRTFWNSWGRFFLFIKLAFLNFNKV